MLHTILSLRSRIGAAAILRHLSGSKIHKQTLLPAESPSAIALTIAGHRGVDTWSMSLDGYMALWLCYAALEAHERFSANASASASASAASPEPLGALVMFTGINYSLGVAEYAGWHMNAAVCDISPCRWR